MSMINDALRRASSAAKSGPGTSPLSAGVAPPPPMPLPPPLLPGADSSFPPPPPFGDLGSELPEPPSTAEPALKNKCALPLILVLLLLSGGAGGAGYYFWKQQKLTAWSQSQPKSMVAQPAVSDFGTPQAPETIVASVISPNVVAAPAPTSPVRPVVVAPAPVAPVTATPAPAPAAPLVPVRFPPLRLQSIFYRPENPSVIINGKTLFIDDQINGVQVADIRSSSVTLVLSGQTNILTLR